MFLSYLLAYLSMGSIFLIALLSVLIRNRKFDLGVKYFRVYFIAAAITDLWMFLLTSLQIVNIQIANIFCVVQFILIALALISWIENKEQRRLLITLAVLATALLVIYLVSIFRFNYLDPISTTAECVLLAILSGYLLIYLTKDVSQYLFKNYKFWFVVSVFIYFSVSSVIYASSNFFVDEQTYLRKYTWNINSALNIITGFLYIKGFLCIPIRKN